MKLTMSCNREHNIVSIWEMGEGSTNSLLCELQGVNFDHKLEMAKRMCAAPELLAACEAVLEVYETSYGPDDFERKTCQYEAVRHAVRKARGGLLGLESRVMSLEACAVCECLYPRDELHDTDEYLGDGSGRDGKIIDPTCTDCIEAKHQEVW